MNAVFSRQIHTGRILLAALGIGVVLTSAGWAQPAVDDPAPAEAFGASLPERANKSLKPVQPTPSERLGLNLGNVPSVRLSPLDKDALLEEDAVRGRKGCRMEKRTRGGPRGCRPVRRCRIIAPPCSPAAKEAPWSLSFP